MLDAEAKRVAQILAEYASRKSKTTYPILADRISWYNKTGQGLGVPLTKVLEFCRSHGLPILTTIVCKTGTDSPSAGGMDVIRKVFGEFDLRAEQAKVRKFDWASVDELELPKKAVPDIDFTRMFATRGFGFDPDRWGMLGFGRQGSRDRILQEMEGLPIYVLQFCSPNQQVSDEEAEAIAPENLGRVMGLLKVLPNAVHSDTHVEPEFKALSIAKWGKDKWPFGLEVERAWIFPERPFARDMLPAASKAGWEATNSIVKLTPEGLAAFSQFRLEETSVYLKPQGLIKQFEQEPATKTYLAVCADTPTLGLTNAPQNTFLVKIGVTNDERRRLLELSGNHIAVIFGLKFAIRAVGKWLDQGRALQVEALAHDWAHRHTSHASGEYFFMTKAQIDKACNVVMLGSRT